MDIFSVIKIVVGLLWGVLFIFIALKTFKAQPFFKGMILVLIELAITAVLIITSGWAVNSAFKKASLNSWSTRFVNGNLTMKGCIRNNGKFKLKNVYLDIKVVNNALGKGKNTSRGRPNTIAWTELVATNIAPKNQKCFTRRHKYPNYFKLSLLTKKLSWD